MELLTNALDGVLRRSLAGVRDDDLARVCIFQKGLDTPLVVTLRAVKDVPLQSLLDLMEKMLQSNEDLVFNESFEIHVGVIRLIRGGKGKKITDITQAKSTKKCIIQVSNKDNMCAARAVSLFVKPPR